jgi:hypothetical protein
MVPRRNMKQEPGWRWVVPPEKVAQQTTGKTFRKTPYFVRLGGHVLPKQQPQGLGQSQERKK